jgi:hypothetical protein
MRVLPIIPITQAARFPARRPPHIIAKEQTDDRSEKTSWVRLPTAGRESESLVYGRPSRSSGAEKL